MPRLLGAEDFGTFSLALGIVVIGSMALAITGPAVTSRFVAAAPPDERAALARALALRALRWRAVGVALGAAAAVVLVEVDPEQFAPFATAMVLTAVLLDAPATVAFQSALALGRIGAWSARYPLQNLVLVGGVVALYVLAGLNGALAAIPLSCAVTLIVGLVLCAKPLVRAPARAPIPRDVSRFALLHSSSNVLLVLQHRGPVVVAALLASSATQTGYAGLAAGVAVAATYAVWQLFTVTLPRFAASAESDPLAVVHALRRVTGLLLLVVAPAAVVGVALVGRLLGPLFGSDFEGAKDAFVPALAIVPLAPLTGAVASVAAIRLRPGARLLTMIAGATTFAVVAAALVPSHDAVGATIALLAATAASTIASVAYFHDVLDVRLVAGAFAGVAAVLAVGVLS